MKKDDAKNTKDKNKCNNKKQVDSNTPKEKHTKDKTTLDNNKNQSAKEKSKKANNKNENPKQIKTKTKCYKITKFHTLFFKPWKYVKPKLVSNLNDQVNTDTIIVKEKKDHKRRKKRKNESISLADVDPKEKLKAKQESRRNRNYRIAAFLADLDWMKKNYKKPEMKEMDDSYGKTKPSCTLLPTKSTYKNKLVAMVQLSNMPFQWREEQQRETCHGVDKVCECMESAQIFCSHKQPTKKKMFKLKEKATKDKDDKTLPPSNIVHKMISTVNVVRKVPMEIKSSICLPKRLSFYRSFRNEVMNQNSGVIDTDVLFKNDDFYEELMAPESNQDLRESSSIHKLTSSSSQPAAIQMSLIESIDHPKTLVATRCKCDYEDTRKQRKPPEPEGKTCPGRISSARTSSGELSPAKNKKPARKRSSSPSPSPKRKASPPPKRKGSPLPKRKASPPTKKKVATPPPKKKASVSKIPLRVRMKHICSSIFGSGCTEKNCPNQKERDRRLERDRLCQSKSSIEASKQKDRIPKKNPDCREKCLPSNEFDDVEQEISSNIKRAMEIARCKERELEKIKEIHRHIEKEQEIEKQIEMEQVRHREREKEIERELGLELARHRQREQNLMCDEDSQTLPPALPPVELPPPVPCSGVVKQYCTAATQDSGTKSKKASKKTKNITTSVDRVICMCDEKVGSDTKGTCTCATQCVQCKKSSSNSRISCGISPSPKHSKSPKRKPSPIAPAKQTCVQVSSINCENSTPHAPKSGWISPRTQHSVLSLGRSLDDQSSYDEPWQNDELSSTYPKDLLAGALSPKASRNFIAQKLRSTANAKVSPIRKHKEAKPKLKESGISPRQSPVHIKVSAGLTYTPRFKDTSVITKVIKPSNNKKSRQPKHYSTLSQITSPVAISTTHSTSNFTTISNPKKSNRAGTKPKNMQITKNDRGRTEKQTSHKGTHCSSLWRRVCRKNKVNARQSIGRRHKLSLESTLYDTGNQSTFDNLLTETNSETTVSSLRSDNGTRTDTTVCSMATVDYDIMPRRNRIFTKSNQATSTEKTNLCDTGTLTYDWWSPIIERRAEAIVLEKKKAYNLLEKENGMFEDSQFVRQIRNSAIVTDERVVKFKSKPQVIPTGMFAFKNEILSPSRYLLESQKYYNELFAYNMSPPFGLKEHVRYQPPSIQDKEKSQTVVSWRTQQRKTKRLDDCYSPRKQYSPRRRYTDSTWTSESPRRRPCSNRKNLNRYYLKLDSTRKSFYPSSRM